MLRFAVNGKIDTTFEIRRLLFHRKFLVTEVRKSWLRNRKRSYGSVSLIVIGEQYRGTVPLYFFSTGTVGTLEKSTGTVPVLLFFNF